VVLAVLEPIVLPVKVGLLVPRRVPSRPVATPLRLVSQVTPGAPDVVLDAPTVAPAAARMALAVVAEVGERHAVPGSPDRELPVGAE